VAGMRKDKLVMAGIGVVAVGLAAWIGFGWHPTPAIPAFTPPPPGATTGAFTPTTPAAPASSDTGVTQEPGNMDDPPTWGAGDMAKVTALGAQVVTAFTTATSPATLRQTLKPLVTDDLYGMLPQIDLSTVPPGTPTGPGILLDPTSGQRTGASDGSFALVGVPTASGQWLVYVSRASQAEPWLAAAVTPPTPA